MFNNQSSAQLKESSAQSLTSVRELLTNHLVRYVEAMELRLLNLTNSSLWYCEIPAVPDQPWANLWDKHRTWKELHKE